MDTDLKKRFVGSAAIAAVLVAIGWWIAGFPFERGMGAFCAYVIFLLVFVFALICPFWD